MRGTDYVFHLAALWLFECVYQPRSALEVNMTGTFNVAEAAHEAGVKKGCLLVIGFGLWRCVVHADD
jgi:UDP-glucose 4-epimerase